MQDADADLDENHAEEDEDHAEESEHQRQHRNVIMVKFYGY